MPRLDDLLDIARVAHDAFLISPAYNARTVFILIDDLCELTFKVWLPSDTASRQAACKDALESSGIINSGSHRTKLKKYFGREVERADLPGFLGASGQVQAPILEATLRAHGPQDALLNWSPEYPAGGFKPFPRMVEEVRQRRPAAANATLHDLLDRIEEQRRNRNQLFHDPAQAGLTVDEAQCLRAVMDFHSVGAELYGSPYGDAIRANSVLAAQVSALRLRQMGHTAYAVHDIRNGFREQRGGVDVPPVRDEHEYFFLHEDPTRYPYRVRDFIEGEIADRQYRITKIDEMKRLSQSHRAERERLLQEVELRREVIDECLILP